MSVLTVVAESVLRDCPSGSIARVNMLRVVELSKIRFRKVQITLEAFQTVKIPQLKDREIQSLLNRECSADRVKALDYIKQMLQDLDKVKEKIEND